MACIADLVAAYMPPHGRGLDTWKCGIEKRSMGEKRWCVQLCDDGANSDEHPLLASGHVREHCPIHPENRENVRVKGSLDLFEW